MNLSGQFGSNIEKFEPKTGYGEKTPLYEYDKYDIMDFLEPEYIDYLETIPNTIWQKFKKEIESVFYKIKHGKVIDYVLEKIKNFDICAYTIKNFEKINLEILKKCFETNFIKVYNKIHKDEVNEKKIYLDSVSKHDLEFNKYFYEKITGYKTKIDPNQNVSSVHSKQKTNSGVLDYILEIFSEKKSNYPDKQNIPINSSFKKMFCDLYVSKKTYISNGLYPYSFDVLKYYVGVFDIEKEFSLLDLSKKKEIFTCLYSKQTNVFDNYDKTIELKNILGITNEQFSNQILFGGKKVNYYYDKPLFFDICKSGNIEYFLSMINNYDIDKKFFTDNFIVDMIVNATMSKNIDLVFIVYDCLIKKQPGLFNNKLYDRILYNIIKRTSPNYHDFDNVIYEFINLGGIIKGYGVYTDYIECIKIKTIKKI